MACRFRNSADNFITLYIGTEEEAFIVNRSDLRKLEFPEKFHDYSSFNFPDYDPAAFNLLCELITRERFPNLVYLPSNSLKEDEIQVSTIVTPYLRLYEHASGFGGTFVRDAIVDQIRSSTLPASMLMTPSIAAHMYSVCAKDSGLRRYLDDFNFFTMQEYRGAQLEDIVISHMMAGNYELVASYTSSLRELVAGAYNLQDPAWQNECFYHDHGVDDECGLPGSVIASGGVSVVSEEGVQWEHK